MALMWPSKSVPWPVRRMGAYTRRSVRKPRYLRPSRQTAPFSPSATWMPHWTTAVPRWRMTQSSHDLMDLETTRSYAATMLCALPVRLPISTAAIRAARRRPRMWVPVAHWRRLTNSAQVSVRRSYDHRLLQAFSCYSTCSSFAAAPVVSLLWRRSSLWPVGPVLVQALHAGGHGYKMTTDADPPPSMSTGPLDLAGVHCSSIITQLSKKVFI